MTREEATEAAETISAAYGDAVLFREPTRRESYQAICSFEFLPPGATPISFFKNGRAA